MWGWGWEQRKGWVSDLGFGTHFPTYWRPKECGYDLDPTPISNTHPHQHNKNPKKAGKFQKFKNEKNQKIVFGLLEMMSQHRKENEKKRKR